MEFPKRRSIRLDEIVALARQGMTSLGPEFAGFVVLEAALRIRSVGGGGIMLADVAIDLTGQVFLLAPPRPGDEAYTTTSLRNVLTTLLSVTVSSSPSLWKCASRNDSTSLASFLSELEGALIPLNREASRRGVSRVARAALEAFDEVELTPQEMQSMVASKSTLPSASRVVNPVVESSIKTAMASTIPPPSTHTHTSIFDSDFEEKTIDDRVYHTTSEVPLYVEEHSSEEMLNAQKESIVHMLTTPSLTSQVTPKAVDTYEPTVFSHQVQAVNSDLPQVATKGRVYAYAIAGMLIASGGAFIETRTRYISTWLNSIKEKNAQSVNSSTLRAAASQSFPSVQNSSSLSVHRVVTPSVCSATLNIEGTTPGVRIFKKLQEPFTHLWVPIRTPLDFVLTQQNVPTYRFHIEENAEWKLEQGLFSLMHSLDAKEALIPTQNNWATMAADLVPISSTVWEQAHKGVLTLTTQRTNLNLWVLVDSKIIRDLQCEATTELMIVFPNASTRNIRIEWAAFSGTPPQATIRL